MSAEFEAWVERAKAIPIEEEILRRGIALKRVGAERIGPCPKCGGTDRFSINTGNGYWNCRQCKPPDVTGDVIGFVTWIDDCDFVAACETLTQEPKPANGYGGEPRTAKREVGWFDYTDGDGKFLFQVVKYDPKDFRQRRRGADGEWIWNLQGVRLVPYHLPELVEAVANGTQVFVVEGEKDAETLAKLGMVATCNPMGAGKWRAEYSTHFSGADVVIIADHDPPNLKTNKCAGFEHAARVAESLIGIANSVRMFDVGELWRGCPDKCDVSDYFANSGTVEALNDFIALRREWTPQAPGQPAPNIITLRTYILPDPETIPPRAMLYANHYMRGTVTSTVAPGGFGKTTLAIYEALSMAVLGLRVWYVTGEDDSDEIDRRIAAHCKQYEVTRDALGDRLIVDDKMTLPIKIAATGKAGPAFDEPKLLALEQAIERARIDVVIFDPLIAFHYLPENDTASMDSLVKRLGEIASRRACCFELTHHVRKPGVGQTEITVYDARGAAALVNAVRSCRVLNQMSLLEAQQAEAASRAEDKQADYVEKRAFYLRVDSGKRNMAPPEKARWWRLLSVTIANGDNVQAMRPWEFPKTFDTLSVETISWIQRLLREKSYRADSRSPDWLGRELAARFGKDLTKKGHIIWIQKVLATWESNNVLVKVERFDQNRNMRKFFELPETAA